MVHSKTADTELQQVDPRWDRIFNWLFIITGVVGGAYLFARNIFGFQIP